MSRLGVVVLLAFACGGSKDEAKQEQPGTGTGTGTSAGPGPAALAIDAAPVALPDATPAPPPLVDLPPLVIGEADEATIKKGINLNNAGYVFHKDKKWAEAEAKYTEAVRADPGNTRARFNLACVYSSSGQTDKAFFVLSQFKQPGCRACDAVLLKAKVDREWKAHLKDPRFLALQDGIVEDKTDIKKVTKQLIKALRSGKADGLEPYVHPRNPIKATVFYYSDEEPKPEYLYGWQGFLKEVAKYGKELEDNGVRECEKNCCETGERGDSSFVVDKVCFEGGGDVLFISSIEYDPGPI